MPLCRSTPTFLPPQHPELGCKYPFHCDPETEDEAKHPDLVPCPEPDCLEQGRNDAEAESRDDTSAIRQPGAISISTRNCQQGPHREESDDGGRRRIDEHSSCAYQDLTHLPLRFRAASSPLTIRRLSPSPSSVPSARRSRSFATSWILFRFPWPGNGYSAVRR